MSLSGRMGQLILLSLALCVFSACKATRIDDVRESPRFDLLREGPSNILDMKCRLLDLTSKAIGQSYSIDTIGRYFDSGSSLEMSNYYLSEDGRLTHVSVNTFKYPSKYHKEIDADTLVRDYDKYGRMIALRYKGQDKHYDYRDSIGLLIIDSDADAAQKDSFWYDESAYPLRHVKHMDIYPGVEVEQWRYYPNHCPKTHELFEKGIRTLFEYWNYDSNGYRMTRFGSRGMIYDSTDDTTLRPTWLTVHRVDRKNQTYVDSNFPGAFWGVEFSDRLVYHYDTANDVERDSVFEGDGVLRDWSTIDKKHRSSTRYDGREHSLWVDIEDASGRSITKQYKDGNIVDSTSTDCDNKGRILKKNIV